jgi:hypothetical protein
MKIMVTVHYKNGTSETYNSNGLNLEGSICDIYFKKQIFRTDIPHKINQIDIKFNTIRKIEVVNALI